MEESKVENTKMNETTSITEKDTFAMMLEIAEEKTK